MIPETFFNETLLGLLQPVRRYLDDPSVSEVMINGPSKVYIERRGKLERVNEVFPNAKALTAALRSVAQYTGKNVDGTRPILEGRLPDGSRVAAVLPPAGPGGPYVAIRRFFRDRLTLDRLIELQTLTHDCAELISTLVQAKLNVVVAGGTASGKTSFLGAISACIPEDERVVVIEDSQELTLLRDHVVTLEARPADAHGEGEVTIRDLFKTTLRMRPDRIVMGEIRGGEALDLVQAMTSGHGGCLTTLHATYPRDVLSRLETMAMMSDINLPLLALRSQIASAIDIVVQVSRLRDGTRKVTHVSEIAGLTLERGTYTIRDLYLRSRDGNLEPTGALPTMIDHLHAQGFRLPASMYCHQ
jgi:pilus assembly protein CpaF